MRYRDNIQQFFQLHNRAGVVVNDVAKVINHFTMFAICLACMHQHKLYTAILTSQCGYIVYFLCGVCSIPRWRKKNTRKMRCCNVNAAVGGNFLKVYYDDFSRRSRDDVSRSSDHRRGTTCVIVARANIRVYTEEVTDDVIINQNPCCFNRFVAFVLWWRCWAVYRQSTQHTRHHSIPEIFWWGLHKFSYTITIQVEHWFQPKTKSVELCRSTTKTHINQTTYDWRMSITISPLVKPRRHCVHHNVIINTKRNNK